jgi:hypothetical protein
MEKPLFVDKNKPCSTHIQIHTKSDLDTYRDKDKFRFGYETHCQKMVVMSEKVEMNGLRRREIQLTLLFHP